MAGGGGDDAGATYSPMLGFVFIFNLIVGAGALAIPAVFSKVGILVASCGLCLLAFTSYVTVTFVVEAMAGVNAILDRERALVSQEEEAVNEEGTDTEALLEDNAGNRVIFHVDRKVEFATMAETLFGRLGVVAFYLCVVIYLFGDLAIYAVAVPKSLRELTCPAAIHHEHQGVRPCIANLNSTQVYRLYVLAFGVLLGSFAFGNMQKTKYIQVATTLIRHAAFISMVFIAVVGILNGKGPAPEKALTHMDYTQFPNFFGVCVYSFMCHHSLPGLLAPISSKRRLGFLLVADYVVVVLVYLVLCTSALLRFSSADIDDVYSLNFERLPWPFFSTFLALFPVFTLSTNFPLIAITLRENLRTLFSRKHGEPAPPARCCGGCCSEQHRFALLAILPPLLVALATEDVSMLVGYTGSYAGMFIQWVIPACLVHSVRSRLAAEGLASEVNPFASPLRSNVWVGVILAWSLLALCLVTVSHVYQGT